MSRRILGESVGFGRSGLACKPLGCSVGSLGEGSGALEDVLPTQSIDPLPHDPSFANEKRGTAESCTCFVGLAGAPVQRCSPRSLPREMPTCPVARGGRGEEPRMRRQACAIRVYASSSCVVWCTCACVRCVARYF